MAGDEPQFGSARHSEQAGIIVDRLATEIERAALNNPQALPDLQEDARQLLAHLEDTLGGGAGEIAIRRRDIAPSGDLDAFVRKLRDLAEELLDLAESRGSAEESSGSDFEPQRVAGALQVLEAELGAELFGEDAPWATITLRAELRQIVAHARVGRAARARNQRHSRRPIGGQQRARLHPCAQKSPERPRRSWLAGHECGQARDSTMKTTLGRASCIDLGRAAAGPAKMCACRTDRTHPPDRADR